MNRELEEFLDGRTLGYSSIFGGWHWRGPGYDEGWEVMDEYDVRKLKVLISLM